MDDNKKTIFTPSRVAPEEAIALERAAKSQKLKRSVVLRGLIRSLGQTSDSPIPA